MASLQEDLRSIPVDPLMSNSGSADPPAAPQIAEKTGLYSLVVSSQMGLAQTPECTKKPQHIKKLIVSSYYQHIAAL